MVPDIMMKLIWQSRMYFITFSCIQQVCQAATVVYTTPHPVTLIVDVFVNLPDSGNPSWTYGIMALFGSLLLLTIGGFIVLLCCYCSCCPCFSKKRYKKYFNHDEEEYDPKYYYDKNRGIWINPKTGAMNLYRPTLGSKKHNNNQPRHPIYNVPSHMRLVSRPDDNNTNQKTTRNTAHVPPMVITTIGEDPYEYDQPVTARDVVIRTADRSYYHDSTCAMTTFPGMGASCTCGRNASFRTTKPESLAVVRTPLHPQPESIAMVRTPYRAQPEVMVVSHSPRTPRRSSSLPDIHKMFSPVQKAKAKRLAMLNNSQQYGSNIELRNHGNKIVPQAVMFSCMDSRIILTRLIQSEVGDHFLVRNAGNLVPHHDLVNYDSMTTEPGALELGCVINNIRHVIVCGHSDCKAMNLLFSIRNELDVHTGTPLQLWLKRHGASSVDKYNQFVKFANKQPLQFEAETPERRFEAFIDQKDELKDVDKFSQINTLQQLHNIASHPMLKDKLEQGEVRLNALWFDVYTGDFFMFSREKKQFLDVSQNYDHLLKDGEGMLEEFADK